LHDACKTGAHGFHTQHDGEHGPRPVSAKYGACSVHNTLRAGVMERTANQGCMLNSGCCAAKAKGPTYKFSQRSASTYALTGLHKVLQVHVVHPAHGRGYDHGYVLQSMPVHTKEGTAYSPHLSHHHVCRGGWVTPLPRHGQPSLVGHCLMHRDVQLPGQQGHA
jgi:hypothetical protein